MNQTKIALVTGAARRIGATIIKHLHQAGFKVIIHYHTSQEEAEALTASLNLQRSHSAYSIQQDLAAPKACENIMAAVLQWGGRLDLLVNNASLFMKTPVIEKMETVWDALFKINVQAPFFLSHQALPLLKQHNGLIINISDIHAVKPLKDYALYCQTKASLNMQTLALAKEFAPIRVNAIAPGAIAWPEQENSLTEGMQQKIIARTLLKRHGNPEDIAKAVVLLAENTFITGQILAVDGGRSIN